MEIFLLIYVAIGIVGVALDVMWFDIADAETGKSHLLLSFFASVFLWPILLLLWWSDRGE